VVSIVLISLLALDIFEAGHRRQLLLFHRSMAVDTTRALAASVQTELNHALTSATQAAMYESGKAGETKDNVEDRLRRYFNQRISAGWEYSNFKEIRVPLSDENSLLLEWLPDGSLRAYGYLDAVIEHLAGIKAFGIRLRAGVVPRYGRLHHLAHLIYGKAGTVTDLETFEDELNENYACEYLVFDLGRDNEGRLTLSIYERYGGRAIVEG
jgi:hypothetical protein